jgi:predicted Zn-dependent peptidase
MKITTLPSGLRVLTLQTQTLTSVVAVGVNVGSQNETPAEQGITHFIEHMLFKGTTSRTALEQAILVEKLGSEINAFTSYKRTIFVTKGLAEHYKIGLELLADMMINSTISDVLIEEEKRIVTQEISESQTDPHILSSVRMLATAFPRHAIGRETLGTKKTVASFTREMITDYMARFYHAKNMIVVYAGPKEHDEVTSEIEELFRDLPRNSVVTNRQPVTYKGGLSFLRGDDPHFLIDMAFRGPGTSEVEQARCVQLLNVVLGHGASSPLFNQLREVEGLCYSVNAAGLHDLDHSLLLVNGWTEEHNVERFIKGTVGEINKIAQGVSDIDMMRAKNIIAFTVASTIEKPFSRIISDVEDVFDLGILRDPLEILESYRRISAEDVSKAAREILESPPTMVVTGKLSALKSMNLADAYCV